MSATDIVTAPVTPLPRDIDVSITINRPQTEIATDMSLLVFCTPNINTLPPNNGRYIIASSADVINTAAGWGPSDTGYWAVKAFFDQSPRPQRMAVGRVFTEPVPAQLMAAAILNLAPIKAVTDGSFSLDLTDPTGTVSTVNIEGMDFASAMNLQSVVAIINSAISGATASNILQATVGYGNRIVITAFSENSAISYAMPGASGTDVSALLNLTQDQGAQNWNAYTPTGLVSEAKLIRKALGTAGSPGFAYAIDKQYRDTPEQKEFADWVESNVFKMAATLCSNSPTAYDAADDTNICFYLKNMGYRASDAVFSSTAQQYPEIAYITDTLSTNYALKDSTGTAKFKNAVGISPENIDETQLGVLESRNCNVFVRVGNNARTWREGTQGADTWWTDSYYGVSNLREELQVAVFNVLLRRRKVPYTIPGMGMIIGAMEKIFNRYVENGFLADRPDYDATLETPYVTRKAYTILPTPMYLATDSERASRTAPPIGTTCYEAGAIHKVNLFIDLVN